SDGSIAIDSIIRYTEEKTGKKAVISADGDPAPYNGFTVDTTYDTEKAKSFGITFRPHEDWIYELIDFYINEIGGK
ncbi:MAG: hypothetical protein IK093_17115, partial [Ruminiclostridium sp.]|nr:hypothetical protein [Ruminiclostridium sp.]